MAGSLSQDEKLSVVAARNSVAGGCLRMIQALATGVGGAGVYVSQTRDFQAAWNVGLPYLGPLLLESMDIDRGSAAEEVLVKGLVEDGKYGLKTGIAMLMTILAATDSNPPNSLFAANGAPRVQDFPVWYTGANRDYINQALVQVAIDAPIPPEVLAPVDPVPQPAEQVIQDAQAGTLPSDVLEQAQSAQNTTVEVFEDGSVVTAQTKKSSPFKLLAVGLGVAVLGGGLYWAARKR